MHVTLLAIGSRGDVQPMIALARGLKARGHHARIATHSNFQSFVEGLGLEYFPLSGDSSKFYGGPMGTAFRDRLTLDQQRYKRFIETYLATYAARLVRECQAACRDTDLIVSWPWTRTGLLLSELYGVPAALLSLAPPTYLATRSFANPYHGSFGVDLSPDQTHATWDTTAKSFETGAKMYAQWRAEVGLPAQSLDDELAAHIEAAQIFAWSPVVLPKPDEWHERIHVSGFLTLRHEQDFEPPPTLVEFLDDGPPPVLFGFGSNVGHHSGLDNESLTEIVVRAVERAGVRALFISGFGGLQPGKHGDDILVTNGVLYSWLLPRCAAMVHHGGAGSMSDGLHAGRPSLGVPFGFDQPLWAQRIHDIGVAPAPIPAQDLTVERLTEAVRQLVEDPSLADGARRVAAALAAEDGVERAVELLERWTLATDFD